MLEPKEHGHEIGEDRSGCANCSLAEHEKELTGFEVFCLNWFYENVSSFTFQTNLIGELMRELELKGMTKKIFLIAMNMIFNHQLSIEREKAKAKEN